MRKLLIVAAAALSLIACAAQTPHPTGPSAQVLPAKPYIVGQQTVFGAKGAYEAALTIAVAYAELPRCKPGTARFTCSDRRVVDQVVQARNVARDALGAAEGIVRSPGFGSDVVKASVDAADAALRAFVSIANTLRRQS